MKKIAGRARESERFKKKTLESKATTIKSIETAPHEP